MVTRLRAWKRRQGETGGYTMVEFALASLVFLLITFGTLDVGRAIYLYSELHTAARDAAREAKVSNANGYGFSNSTINHRIHYAKNLINSTEKKRTGLGTASGTASCTGSCQPGDLLTVQAELPFSAVLPGFLGIEPFTLHATATVKME
jgi:Flp pilus assembly protein TadG